MNSITKRDVYPLPRVQEALDVLGKVQYFSSIDMVSGYWQIPMAEEDKDKTAFICSEGLFNFERMPFGLVNAPSVFCRTEVAVCIGILG